MECNAVLFVTGVPRDRRERRVGQLSAECHSIISQKTGIFLSLDIAVKHNRKFLLLYYTL
jgi:hypothetical protein